MYPLSYVFAIVHGSGRCLAFTQWNAPGARDHLEGARLGGCIPALACIVWSRERVIDCSAGRDAARASERGAAA